MTVGGDVGEFRSLPAIGKRAYRDYRPKEDTMDRPL
jgi:hypothetical protein